jgi:hypothetical protein
MARFNVSNFPSGLTGILNMKAFGDNPNEIAPFYTPTFETLELFLLNNQEFLNNAGVAAVNNTGVLFPSLLVPNNEQWWVWDFDVQTASMGVGQAIRLAPYKFTNGTAGQAVALAPARGATGAAVNEQVVVCAQSPFWLKPGQQLGFLAETLTGAVNVSAHAFLSRFRV